ncbi:squalene/phytoene synthase family protein [Sphingomonas sp.]|uniref:squalene/phytoene synthase family protein n=1 Tax=Sphingomonas sp. TaxID=28214 RepID=UPI0025F4BB0D|nr:squalene/phytoene synthase family protein [Sphingomonas sp.]
MIDPELADSERVLALNYAPKSRRAALGTLWQLDETLGRVVATTTEPVIGQIRLTWWHERLSGLTAGEASGEPLLGRLAEHVLPYDVTGTDLAMLIEGWEALLELPLDDAALAIFADQRGGMLFALSARILSAEVPPIAGQGWALVDFAAHCSDPKIAASALAMVAERLRDHPTMPRPLRILSRLASARSRLWARSMGASLPRFVFLRAVLG